MSRAVVGSLVGAALVVLAASVTFVFWTGGDDDGEAAGEPAPEVSFEMFDGSTVSMADYAGQPVLVNFWASWCPPCVAEMPDLETVHQEVGDEVAFLGINTQDAPGPAAELVDETGVTYDLARDPDGRLFQEFGGFGMPTTLFVSPDGRIVDQHTGIMTLEQIRAFVEDGRER